MKFPSLIIALIVAAEALNSVSSVMRIEAEERKMERKEGKENRRKGDILPALLFCSLSSACDLLFARRLVLAGQFEDSVAMAAESGAPKTKREKTGREKRERGKAARKERGGLDYNAR